MITFCQVCRAEIPPERVSKKARTCSEECQKQYRSQMRSERAERKCRLCGRSFRKSRVLAGVLHEHTELSEVVTPPLSIQSSPSVFFGGVSAAVTSERQEQSTPTALIGAVETVEKLCTADNHFIAKPFTEQSNSQCEVETLLTVGAELPVESRPQAGEQDFQAAPVEISEISQNEVTL